MREKELTDRKMAIHLLRQGSRPKEVASELGRSLAWVYKWRKRYFTHSEWQILTDQSHAPHHVPRKLPDGVRQAIRVTRSELEAEAKEPGKLSYRGAYAVQARLRQKGVEPLPSISSIERELRDRQ
jgi:transposase